MLYVGAVTDVESKPKCATERRGDGRAVAALFGLALLVRGVAALRIEAIFNDGPVFLEIAEQMARGDFATALRHQYHPLYPLLVAAGRCLQLDLEFAARAVSIVSGSVAVVALYFFLRRAFDRETAWIGGVLLALHPYAAEFSADVQSEGLYMALFLAAVAALWRSLEERALPVAFSAGALAGLAYLVRPEGLGLVAVGVVVAAHRVAARRWSLGEGARVALAIGFGALLLAGPYVVHLHALTGEWQLTQKKSLRDLTTPAEQAAPLPPGIPNRERFGPRPGARATGTRGTGMQETRRETGGRRVAEWVSEWDAAPHAASVAPVARLDRAFARAVPARMALEPRELEAGANLLLVASGSLHVLFVLLLGIGLFLSRGRPGDRGTFLAVLVAVYAVALYALTLNVGYLSRRHVLVPLLPLFGYAALAVPGIGRALLRLFRRPPDAHGLRAAVLSLAFVAAITLPKTWSPQREESLATRRAAEWLAGRPDLVGPVAAGKSRDAYYARQAYIDLARGGPNVEPALLRRAGARFLIVDDEQLARLPGLRDAQPRFRELYRVEAAGRIAWVYELPDAPR